LLTGSKKRWEQSPQAIRGFSQTSWTYSFLHYWLVPGLASFSAFKAFDIQVFPATKVGTEQGDPIFGGGEIINPLISAIMTNRLGLGCMGFGFGLGRLVF
jgi:hypothetical protein